MIGVENRRRERVVNEMRNRPREDVGEVSGDERNIRGGRAIGGVASRKILIENREFTALNGPDQRLATGIAQRREPSTIMSVEIAQDDGISSHVIQ